MADAPLRALAPRQSSLDASASPDRHGPKEHSEAEWETHRSLIDRLYIAEGRKLVEVMSILRSRHGFDATEQMYKKRLRKWNIRKRSYRKSASGIVTPTSTPSLDADDDADETLPHKPCLALDHHRLSSPGPFGSLELVLDSVCVWSLGKLDSFALDLDPMSRYLASPNKPPMADSRTMYRTFELVFDLWSHGKGQLAGMAARRAFYALEFVLTEDHPDIIWHILDAIYDMADRGHTQLLGIFLTYANMLARTRLPTNHPLLRILHQLVQTDYQTDQGRQQLCHTLAQAWRRNSNILAEHIGSLAPRHLWLYEQLIWDGRTPLRKGTSNLAERKEAMLNALGALLQRHHPPTNNDPLDHDHLRIAALMLEYTQMDLGDKQQAHVLAQQLLDRTASDAGGRSNARFHAYACKMMARLQHDRHDFVHAEKNLRCAVVKREAAHGADSDLRVIRDMWVLAAHLKRANRHDDAAQTIRDALARAERFLRQPDASCVELR
ncbi:hypothetical protein CDD82_7324 [Ophiocordyceps australis]|uniref:Clr5 domain-containing protein n=1 Tax=Ophiocordyceps australis TaxID=1399860 RepID=A0A2C5ZLS2_9HYPO|nr:hypothetical protein CDD82_7324 [Ophiocordyceps australis]